MQCYICDADENFHSLKELNPERELMVCKDCGNICYRVEPVNEDKVKEYYRKEYRPAPNHMNLLTTTNKLNYIRLFLKDYLKDKKGLVCGDVGCATGYTVNWLRSLGHKALGCEYTLTYRRFAEHFYGFPVTEELPTKHKYDFISIYHVLEHLVEPDKKLAHYASLLTDDGRMMIACPQWMDTIEEASGSSLLMGHANSDAAFRHWFHKDHINVFTENSIKRLFAKCGLAVEKEDFIQYGQTYLIRKAKPGEIVKGPPKEDWKKQVDDIDRIRQALKQAYAGDLRAAISIWPKFTEAWIRLIFEKAMKQPDKQIALLQESKPHLEDNARMRMALGIWFYQRQEYDKALDCFKWLVSHKPNNDAFVYMGYCLTHLNRYPEAMNAFNEALVINPTRWVELINWVCKCAASMPTWDERAVANIKEKIYAGNKDKFQIEPIDPLFPKETNGKEKGNHSELSQPETPRTPESAHDENKLVEAEAGQGV